MPENDSPGGNRATAIKKLYLLSSVGIQLVVSILIGLAFGKWLDGKFDTTPALMLLFMFLGVCAGFLNVYRMAVKEGKE